MIYGFVGSRDYGRLDLVAEHVRRLAPGDVVVTGAWWAGGELQPTRGVDRAAAEAARDHGLTVVLVAGSPKHGKGAGLVRNPTVVDVAQRVVAYWSESSRGTIRTSLDAYAKGKLARIFGSTGQLIAIDRFERAIVEVLGPKAYPAAEMKRANIADRLNPFVRPLEDTQVAE